jgi:hypothetical protein
VLGPDSDDEQTVRSNRKGALALAHHAHDVTISIVNPANALDENRLAEHAESFITLCL